MNFACASLASAKELQGSASRVRRPSDVDREHGFKGRPESGIHAGDVGHMTCRVLHPRDAGLAQFQHESKFSIAANGFEGVLPECGIQ
eukprot:2120901-Amphidinium_carterae.1